MPAGIALKVNHAEINTQVKGADKKADKNALKDSPEKVSDKKEKSVISDFKKMLDKKIEKNGKKDAKKEIKKEVNKTGEKAVEKNTAEKELKVSPEKSAEFKSDFNPETDKQNSGEINNAAAFAPAEDKKTALKKDTDSSLVSSVLNQRITDGIKKNSASEKNKINRSDENTEKTESSKKEEVKLQVLDLRSRESSEKKESGSSFSFNGSSEKNDLNTESSEQKNDSSQFKDGIFIKADAVKNETPVKSLTSQQTEVLNRLKSEGNNEIVKQTKIILNDSNSGELKMVLKPEKLGFVRIKLNLDDNNIVGRIIVDNNNIKEIFENNMESLLRSFRESGFGTASLEVSVGGGKGRKQDMDSNERFFSKKIIEEVDNHNIISRGITDDSLIDLVV